MRQIGAVRRASSRGWRSVLARAGMATATSTGGRGYAAAIDALNSLQSNAATIEAIRRSGRTVNELNEHEMVEYLGRIGHPVCGGVVACATYL